MALREGSDERLPASGTPGLAVEGTLDQLILHFLSSQDLKPTSKATYERELRQFLVWLGARPGWLDLRTSPAIWWRPTRLPLIAFVKIGAVLRVQQEISALVVRAVAANDGLRFLFFNPEEDPALAEGSAIQSTPHDAVHNPFPMFHEPDLMHDIGLAGLRGERQVHIGGLERVLVSKRGVHRVFAWQ